MPNESRVDDLKSLSIEEPSQSPPVNWKSDDFWVDYEGGSLRLKFTVYVYGDFSDYFESSVSSVRNEVPNPSNADELKAILSEKIRLWSCDFVVMCHSDFMVKLLNRGLRYRLYRDSRRIHLINDNISNCMIKSNDCSNVVFLSLTYDPSKFSLADAWKDVRRRFKKVVRYFKRHHGVICASSVVEAMENFYPHLHMTILLEKPAETFEDKKGIRRFADKKDRWVWGEDGKKKKKRGWERVLGKEGFIDAFAPKSANDVRSYLSKYMDKVKKALSENSDPGDLLNNPKALGPFLCRLFKVPMVIVYPKGFEKKLLGYEPKRVERPPEEEILLAHVVWSFKYGKPIDGIPSDDLRYWDHAQRRIHELCIQYYKVKYGREPDEEEYDLIKLSRIQSAGDLRVAAFLLGLLHSLFEATKLAIVLGYCQILTES